MALIRHVLHATQNGTLLGFVYDDALDEWVSYFATVVERPVTLIIERGSQTRTITLPVGLDRERVLPGVLRHVARHEVDEDTGELKVGLVFDRIVVMQD